MLGLERVQFFFVLTLCCQETRGFWEKMYQVICCATSISFFTEQNLSIDSLCKSYWLHNYCFLPILFSNDKFAITETHVYDQIDLKLSPKT